jgi:alpha-ketoglutarate-dependent taurine dioxygenase
MQLPIIMESDPLLDIHVWVKENLAALNAKLDMSGAVLIRGCKSSEPAFKALAHELSSDHLKYMYRSTPRTDLGGGVFTATEYPPGMDIPMHNENAYQREWPLRLMFYCAYPADGGGGQTPLANTVNVTHRIDPAIRERFRNKRVMYIRNFRSDIDLPWQTVFQTESKMEVEEYCRRHDISYEWNASGNLRTKQICEAFAKHPQKGIDIWFNQAHLFHPSALEPRTREVMLEMFKEEDFPRNVTYGDGSAISESELENIREAFKKEMVVFQWRAGDLLVLNNMLVSHGRKSFKGKRRVLVSMSDLSSSDRTGSVEEGAGGLLPVASGRG